MKEELEHGGVKGQKTIMYWIRDNIDAKAKIRVIKIINAMLEGIEEMKRALGIDIREELFRGEMAGYLSEIWVVLEELTPNQLKAYGKVSEEEKALIEPRVKRLLLRLDEIEAIFNG